MNDLPTLDELLAEEIAKNPGMYEKHPSWTRSAAWSARQRWIGECATCSEPIYASARGPLPRFCSSNCRVASHRRERAGGAGVS